MSISAQDWSDFYKAIHDHAPSVFNKVITWQRATSNRDRWGEESIIRQTITLKGLINYNYMRSWPVTFATESGELDRQSMQVLFLKKDLADAGYLNAHGYFEYNTALDRFIIDGLVHKPMGDTPVSQANGDDLYITVIMKREETQTGNAR